MISKEMLYLAGDKAVKIFQDIIDCMMIEGRMPSSWCKSHLIPIYKGKGSTLDCSNYRSVKLLEHGMKVIETVFEQILRDSVEINQMQFGFMSGKGTSDAIFVVRQLIEKKVRKNQPLYLGFIDLAKAFDTVPRHLIVWALRRKLVNERLIGAIMTMYTSSMTSVVLEGSVSASFEVKVGVHQGSVLSPFLFNIVVDEIISELDKKYMYELLYADDLVLIGDTKEELENKIKMWKAAIEKKGLKVNMRKTKWLKVTGTDTSNKVARIDPCGVCSMRVKQNSILCTTCNKWVHKRCSGVKGKLCIAKNFKCFACEHSTVNMNYPDERIIVDGEEIERVKEFVYLGDVLEENGSAIAAVELRVKCAWSKFRELSGLLCSKGLSLRRKGLLYKAGVRSVLLYGVQGWPLRESEKKRVVVCENRMLRMMYGVTLKDRIKSEELRNKFRLECIDKVAEIHRLRWFGHVLRRPVGTVTRDVVELKGDKHLSYDGKR